MKNQNLLRGKRTIRLMVLSVIVVAVLAIGLFVYSKKSQDKPLSEQYPTQPIAQIRITKKGFEPAVLSVKPGTLVIWTNDDESPHQVASNSYPTDDGLPGLKSELLNNTQTYQYEADDTGTFGYHDELNPTVNGSLVVGQ